MALAALLSLSRLGPCVPRLLQIIRRFRTLHLYTDIARGRNICASRLLSHDRTHHFANHPVTHGFQCLHFQFFLHLSHAYVHQARCSRPYPLLIKFPAPLFLRSICSCCCTVLLRTVPVLRRHTQITIFIRKPHVPRRSSWEAICTRVCQICTRVC